jgi:hypothetical protein
MRPLAALAGSLLTLSFAALARGDMTGKAAPPITFTNTWNATGEKSLKDFQGKVVFLEFFTTW